MIDDYIDELITISIPAKKYSNEWDSELLRSSVEETFKINLPISNWFDKDNFVLKESLPSVFEEKPESDNMTKVTSSQIARQKVQREVCLGSVSGIKIDNDDQS